MVGRTAGEGWAGVRVRICAALRDPTHRAEFATLLADVDLVIAGPLSSLGTEGGGTLDEIHEFEGLMRLVRELASRPIAFALIHHPNRAGQVSGAWERAPDTLVHVLADGHGRTRVYWQKVRWCSSLHKTTTYLAWADGDTFTVAEREEITSDTMAAGILEAATFLPGGSWTPRGSGELGATGCDERPVLVRPMRSRLPRAPRRFQT